MLNLNAILIELDKAKKLPWKGIFGAISIGFLGATGVSILANHLLFPENKDLKIIPKARNVSPIQKPKPSLQEQAINQIIERNLFNKEGKTGEEDAVEQSKEQPVYSGTKAIKSTLPLKLLGTIYGGDPYSGIALIEDTSKRNQNSFFVGDLLAQNAKIIEIHREKVIIDRGDHREYIELERKQLVSKRRKKSSGSARPAAKKIYATEPPPEAYKEEGFERQGNAITMSSDFRRKLLTTDFAKILQDAKAEPHLVGGELNGFRLTRIREDSIYQKAGLQNGDVVKEINGVSLVDTAQAIKLLNSLRGENDLEVRLERGGVVQTINLQVR